MKPVPIKQFVFGVIVVLIGTACQAPLSRLKPVLKDEGEIFLYLEPFTQEEKALSFTLREISAVRDDGVEVPLAVRFTELKGSDLNRQRLLASGVLPAGGYRGLVSTASHALLRVENSEVSLEVPDAPEKSEFHFDVKPRKATVISLQVPYARAVKSNYGFRPAFSCSIPTRPLPLLTGYVTNPGANMITVFDKRAGEVREVIETGQGPKGMALDPLQNKAYVAVSGEDAIEVIDVITSEIINKIPLTHGDRPAEIALRPDGKLLLVTDSGSNTVSFVDPASLLEISRLTVGFEPVTLLLGPSGKKAYVFNYLSSSISVIDVDNRAVVATIPTDPGPVRGALTRQGDRLIVLHDFSPYMLVVDPGTFAVTKKIHVGMGASSIRVDTATNTAYIGKKNSSTLDISPQFNLFPNDFPSDFLSAGGGPSRMVFDGDTGDLLVLLPEQQALQRINIFSKKAVFRIDVGDDPYWVTIMGER